MHSAAAVSDHSSRARKLKSREVSSRFMEINLRTPSFPQLSKTLGRPSISGTTKACRILAFYAVSGPHPSRRSPPSRIHSSIASDKNGSRSGKLISQSERKLNRKLVHITLGLAFMLCWPMFSSGRQGALLAALIPAVNIIKMLLLGLGIWKDDATVKSMSRFGDHRELLKGPLYYASTIALASAIYWRTSPIAIAAVCNMCAGDGMADIVGRRFGGQKLPYNKNKSVVGSITMTCAGFLASIGYMLYFSSFGYMEESSQMVLGFLVVSIATALIESLPISTELDDNLTVPLTAVVVGSLIF